MRLRSGDLLTYNPEHHYVYELIDDDGEVFYVGRSTCPQGRLKEHWGKGQPEIQRRLRASRECFMRIVHGPVTEGDAMRLERQEIDRPGRKLLNQQHQPIPAGRTTKRLPIFEQFARTASKAPNP